MSILHPRATLNSWVVAGTVESRWVSTTHGLLASILTSVFGRTNGSSSDEISMWVSRNAGSHGFELRTISRDPQREEKQQQMRRKRKKEFFLWWVQCGSSFLPLPPVSPSRLKQCHTVRVCVKASLALLQRWVVRRVQACLLKVCVCFKKVCFQESVFSRNF